ncbi:hypothetical protein LZ30DRAFT_197829 [Colletotrichum cereale]|nr:hypothetical protein LZ30DRAFT_197829 [Colletotrichum cereale]
MDVAWLEAAQSERHTRTFGPSQSSMDMARIATNTAISSVTRHRIAKPRPIERRGQVCRAERLWKAEGKGKVIPCCIDAKPLRRRRSVEVGRMTSTARLSTASFFLGGTLFFRLVSSLSTRIARHSRTLCVCFLGSHDEAYAYVAGGSLVFQSSPLRPGKLVPKRWDLTRSSWWWSYGCFFATGRRPRSAGQAGGSEWRCNPPPATLP